MNTADDGDVTETPPLRQSPDAQDADDGKRSAWAWHRWNSQNQIFSTRDRTIEEMVRMLSGQQWWVWYAPLGRFVDVAYLYSKEERRWRQRPVFNRLLPWFLATHARVVENPPICTFLPGPDRYDSELAETMDTIYKSLWRQTGMVDVNDRLWAWVLVGGTGYVKCRIDPNGGDLEEWIGGAQIPVVDPQTGEQIIDNMGQPVSTWLEECPLGKEGEPLAVMLTTGELQFTGEAHVEREGGLVNEVMSPFGVRGQWGDQPWHLKTWHADLSYLTPEQVMSTWGVEVDAESLGTSGNAGELERMTFGQGNFGANMQKWGSESSSPQTGADEYVRVLTMYDRPNDSIEGMHETMESPGGRMMVVTGDNKVLYDGPRPVRWPFTSPIHRWDFVRLPGSNSGRTPLETQVGPQRSFNRGWAQILEHRNLVTNPIALVDRMAGLQNVRVTNQPGKRYIVNSRPGVEPMKWLSPPDLGADVYKVQEQLLRELTELGNLKGTDGDAPQRDASGELIKELRFNSDRFLGPTVRRGVEEYSRLIQTWMVMLPLIWSKPKIMTMAGEDNVARTLMVYPDLFEKGKIQVVPDVESMLPEGRGEKMAKTLAMYREGMFGQPGSPEAVKIYLEMARFPHLSKAARPGGVQRETAEAFNGRLVQGAQAAEIPWYPWYDPFTHVDVLQTFMGSTDFLREDPQIQQQFGLRWQMVKEFEAMALAQMAPPPQEQGPGGKGSEPKSTDSQDRALTPAPASSRTPRSITGQYPTAP